MEKIILIEKLTKELKSENYFQNAGRFPLTRDELQIVIDNDEEIERRIGTYLIEQSVNGDWSVVTGKNIIEILLLTAPTYEHTEKKLKLPGGREEVIFYTTRIEDKVMAYTNTSEVGIMYDEEDDIDEVLNNVIELF